MDPKIVVGLRPCLVYNELDEVGTNGVISNEAIENYKKYGISKPTMYGILKTKLEK